MRYHRLIVSSMLVLFVVYHSNAAYAKAAEVKITKGEGPVDIEADQLIYERNIQTYQAHGDVEVKRDDLFLKADHARMNVATKDVTAWGNVLLREGEDVVECERLEVNLETRVGKIYKARLFLKEQNFHITGQEAEKLGESRYRVRDGSFTTCDATRPPWRFTVKELDVTLTGQGIAEGPAFYFEDIPVLYFPWATFPVRKERQTGFFLPEGGYSDTYGFKFKDAFYWAITKDMDATLYVDRHGDRGFKEGVEYRYAFTKDTRGQAIFYFIDDQVSDKNRYAFFIQHEQKLPYDFYLKGDINRVSDRFYPVDFDEDLPDKAKIDSRSLNQLRSVLFGGKNWDQFSFIADGRVFQDLTKDSNDETVQKLPEISFFAHPQSLFKTPLFYDLTSSYVNFSREKGVEAHRWDLFPQIFYPTRFFNVLKFESNVGLRETAYNVYNDPTNTLRGWKSRQTIQADMEMSAEFYRVYDASLFQGVADFFKVAKWMHTIEPTVSYNYSPRVNQNGLPTFDDVDRIPFTDQITYGITQRLIGRPEKEGETSGPYEYAKLRVFQSYSLGDPFARDSKGRGEYFSDIQTELWLYFSPYITGRWEVDFNPYQRNFDVLNAYIMAKDERNDAVQIQYRFTKDNIQQASLLARVRTIKPLYLYGGISYNLLLGTRVESLYGGEYQAQCWSIGLLVEDINRSPDGTQKKELRFHVYFNLLGIGSGGQRSYFMRL
jgi:LPS-assembly protein